MAVLAWMASQWTPPTAPRIAAIRPGRNNTVLFLTNSEFGLANVLVATAYALLTRYPEVEVHYASFPSMARTLERISEQARQKQPSARSIVYHKLPDLSFLDIVAMQGRETTSVLHPPGHAGVKTIIRDMPYYTSPWSGEDHMRLFHKFTGISAFLPP